MDEPIVDPEIDTYYSGDWDEDARLRTGLGELELIRTRDIVTRFMPDSPVDVLDVGGGSGVHAEWLLDLGHRVELVDPVQHLVNQAAGRLGDMTGFNATRADARALPFGNGRFDAVLLFGPLYHLTDRSDRMTVWEEASRVCKPGGVIFAAVISRFASLFSGLSGDVIFDETFRGVVERDLIDGQHRNPEGRDYFTTAYFHHPDEVVAEAVEGGLQVEAVLGVEGIGAWIPRLERSWEDPERRAIIVEAARAIESEPTLLGLGPHLIVVARKPGE